MTPSTDDGAAPRRIVLASSSPYRRSQLERLGLPFEWRAPDVDESRHGREPADELVERLARAKAEVVAATSPDHIVVAGDQVATIGAEVIGKPASDAHAAEQLLRASGRTVTFLSGLYVTDTRTAEDAFCIVPVEVEFRPLSRVEVEAYVALDQPLDCAGSFRSESLGPTLCRAIRSEDPSALLGLPLIALCRILRTLGVSPLAP